MKRSPNVQQSWPLFSGDPPPTCALTTGVCGEVSLSFDRLFTSFFTFCLFSLGVRAPPPAHGRQATPEAQTCDFLAPFPRCTLSSFPFFFGGGVTLFTPLQLTGGGHIKPSLRGGGPHGSKSYPYLLSPHAQVGSLDHDILSCASLPFDQHNNAPIAGPLFLCVPRVDLDRACEDVPFCGRVAFLFSLFSQRGESCLW